MSELASPGLLAQRTETVSPPFLVAEPPLVGEAPRSSASWWTLVLLGLGVVEVVLLGWFSVLYVNFPRGYNVLYGLSLTSADLFRSALPYPAFSLAASQFTPVAIATILLLWMVYLAASLALPASLDGESAGLAAVIVLGVTVLASIVLVAMPPVLSADVYHDALFGRMVAFYRLNPYVVSDAALRRDSLWSLAFWQDVTTHYGPVWTLLSAGLAWIGAGSSLLTVLSFKTAAALFNLASCLLVFQLARELSGGSGVKAMLLYAWNPLILIESAGSGHNEVVMMAFALLGLLLVVRRRVVSGVVALTLSVLVTYLTAILGLFVVVRLLAWQRSWAGRLPLALRLGSAAGLTVAVLFAPFWAGPRTLGRLLEVGATFKTPFRYGLRELVAHWLARGGDVAAYQPLAGQIVSVGLNVAFVPLIAFLVWRLAAGAQAGGPSSLWGPVLETWGVASLVYVTFVYGWFFPWYLIMPMATVFGSPPSRTTNRLAAACNGLGVAWMLLYGIALRV